MHLHHVVTEMLSERGVLLYLDVAKSCAATDHTAESIHTLAVGSLLLYQVLKGVHEDEPAVYPCADQASRIAAGVPALHAASTKALHAALQRLTAPRHLGLLLYLLPLVHFTLLGAPLLTLLSWCDMRSRLQKCDQQLVAAWSDAVQSKEHSTSCV